jgi:hypothetical protein
MTEPTKFTTITGSDWRVSLQAARARRTLNKENFRNQILDTMKPRNPNGRPPLRDYSLIKARAVSLLREGYSVNDIQRAASVPLHILVQWRNEAGIKPRPSGFNSNRGRLPYLEQFAVEAWKEGGK